MGVLYMSDSLRWVNLHKNGERNNPEKKVASNIKYKLINELFVIGKLEKYLVVFAPLLMRLFVIPKTYIQTITPLTFKQEFVPQLVEGSLLVPYHEYYDLQAQMPTEANSINLRILFSSSCNLQCAYCYADAKEKGQNIELDKLTKLLDSFPADVPIKIEFHGNGEPSMAMSEVKKATKLIRKRFPESIITLQSNGQFKKREAEWFVHNRIGIGFSFDGPEYIHNRQRPAFSSKQNSFNKVLKNIKFMQNHGGGRFVLAVVTEYSLPHLMDIYEYFKSIGIQSIKFDPIVSVGRAARVERPEQSPPDIHEFAIKYAEIQKRAFEDNILIDSDFMPSFHSSMPSLYRCQAVSPCYVVDVNGDLLSCAEGYYLADKEVNPFFYGEIGEGKIIKDSEKVEYLKNRNVNNMPECQKCFLKYNCSGGCLVESFIENGDIYIPVKKHCSARKKMAIEFCRYLADKALKENVSELN